ncbi:hypothetical protein BGX31_010010 [Mortierella sp. GBA43]|nr:hypothetical protein BGX31_010010 [Mortierella sp. GBA43]
MEYRSSQEETAMGAWRHIVGDNLSLQLELISDHKRIEGFWATLQKFENYERGKAKRVEEWSDFLDHTYDSSARICLEKAPVVILRGNEASRDDTTYSICMHDHDVDTTRRGSGLGDHGDVKAAATSNPQN